MPSPAFLCRGPAAWPVAGLSAAGTAGGRSAGRDRAGVRARAGLGPGARPDRRVVGGRAAAGRTGAPGRCPLLAAADLRPVNNLRSYSRDIVNLLLIDRRPLGTSLEMPDYGNWVRRQPLLALPGTPIWTTVQTQAGEGLRRQFAALSAGPGAAHGRRLRADPAAGLHGHLLRKPRPAVPFRFLAGGPRRRNAAAGHDAATAEPGTGSHRALGGRRQHGRHGRVQPAAGQRRDPPRRSRADRDAHVAGPRLAMRGPAGRGQSAESHPARHSRIGAISSN